MRVVGKPTVSSSFSPLPSVALGADQQAVALLVGVISGVVGQHKEAEHNSPIFRIADLNIGDGAVAACVVDAFRRHCHDASALVQVSGTELDAGALEQARETLTQRNALGTLGLQDASSCPASELRNKLQCGGGADMVVYAHAAYPCRLPAFKLSRMVDRLGDMVASHGAIMTLHNHGPSDVDNIRKQVLGLPILATAGMNCNTQQKLEQAFNDAHLHSFSVTVPNAVTLPANMQAIEAIFANGENTLNGKDAKDAATIRTTLEKVAGGAEKFATCVAEMDAAARDCATGYFAERIRKAGGADLPLTVGGGQMVLAFRTAGLAQEAFAAINRTCQSMEPPAIALPISRDVMPEFDKHSAHKEWKGKLAEQGITNPPRVCQTELDNTRQR